METPENKNSSIDFDLPLKFKTGNVVKLSSVYQPNTWAIQLKLNRVKNFQYNHYVSNNKQERRHCNRRYYSV